MGGVDSSLAAALLKKAGYEVIGVTMQIWPSEKQAFGGCCGLEAIEDAKKVAYKLSIPHYVMNFRDIFARRVIADFCREYSLGRTPNPCIRCNQHIKFDALLNKVQAMGADYLATGHYARIGQRELQYLLLPLGNLYKTEVRRLAAELGLPTSSRPDSQDVCFVPDNNYRSFITQHITQQPGDIVDIRGKILGKHNGLAQYTVGQRQGLGLNSNKRLYVLKLDTTGNRLVVGTEDQLLSNALSASKLSWVSGEAPREPIRVTAKVRYKSPGAEAKLNLNGEMARVQFHQPQRAIAPGQAIASP